MGGLRRAPWLTRYATGPGTQSRLASVYYDTEDLALRDQRAILRVRETDGRYVQTFKAEIRSLSCEREASSIVVPDIKVKTTVAPYAQFVIVDNLILQL
jgi:adenylate cyclase class IV